MASLPPGQDRSRPGTVGKPPSSLLPSLTAALLLLTFALYQGLTTNNARDFFIYRLGAQLAARGENPYDLTRLRPHVAEAYPETDENTQEFVANCGFFLPPLAVVAFLPLAAMPTIAAKVCWAVLNAVAAFFVARLPSLSRGGGSSPPGVLAQLLAPFILVLNPLIISVVLVGQVSLVSVGAVAAGVWCLGRGRPYLTALLWVVPFLKPHLALPLIPLLWFLAGWRPAAVLVSLVVILNLLGATVAGGSPLFLKEYLDSLSSAHKSVGFNRVEANPRLSGWNSLLRAAGGPLIELNALTTAAGYLVWFGLVVGRVALAGVRPCVAWALAAAAVGAVLCSQVLLYELVILTLLVPWVRDLFDGDYRLRGLLVLGLFAVLLIPWMALQRLGISFPPSLTVVLMAVLVLVGPVGKSSAVETARSSL